MDKIVKYLPKLIRGMKKSEKRFFKMCAGTEGGHIESPLRLFDIIEKDKAAEFNWDKHKEFSEYEIERLYEIILRALKYFHTPSSEVFKWKDEILNLRCLLDKAQYRQCRKMLAGVKTALYEKEAFSSLLKLMDIEKKLTFHEEGNIITSKVAMLLKEEEGLIEKEKKILKLYELDFNIRCEINNRSDKVANYLSEPLFNNNSDLMSVYEQYLVLSSKSRIFRYLNDVEKHDKCINEIQTLFIKHPYLKETKLVHEA